jgi:hypothetical protein
MKIDWGTLINDKRNQMLKRGGIFYGFKIVMHRSMNACLPEHKAVCS